MGPGRRGRMSSSPPSRTSGWERQSAAQWESRPAWRPGKAAWRARLSTDLDTKAQTQRVRWSWVAGVGQSCEQTLNSENCSAAVRHSHASPQREIKGAFFHVKFLLFWIIKCWDHGKMWHRKEVEASWRSALTPPTAGLPALGGAEDAFFVALARLNSHTIHGPGLQVWEGHQVQCCILVFVVLQCAMWGTNTHKVLIFMCLWGFSTHFYGQKPNPKNDNPNPYPGPTLTINNQTRRLLALLFCLLVSFVLIAFKDFYESEVIHVGPEKITP